MSLVGSLFRLEPHGLCSYTNIRVTRGKVAEALAEPHVLASAR